MRWRSWNKLIAASAALAATGILMCAVAVLNVLAPTRSLLGFLVWMALLALAVAAVAIGYTWVCDKCDGFFRARSDRLPGRRKPNRTSTVNSRVAPTPRANEQKVDRDNESNLYVTRFLFSSGRHIETLRGGVSKAGARARRFHRWFGP